MADALHCYITIQIRQAYKQQGRMCRIMQIMLRMTRYVLRKAKVWIRLTRARADYGKPILYTVYPPKCGGGGAYRGEGAKGVENGIIYKWCWNILKHTVIYNIIMYGKMQLYNNNNRNFLIYKLLTPPVNWGSKPTFPERIARVQSSQKPARIFICE